MEDLEWGQQYWFSCIGFILSGRTTIGNLRSWSTVTKPWFIDSYQPMNGSEQQITNQVVWMTRYAQPSSDSKTKINTFTFSWMKSKCTNKIWRKQLWVFYFVSVHSINRHQEQRNFPRIANLPTLSIDYLPNYFSLGPFRIHSTTEGKFDEL
jgi:hypothetical protein